jgi:hypothetical protein
MITTQEGEEYRKVNFDRLNQEDLDPNQQLDWNDIFQRYCAKHKRNFHFTCRACYP